MKYLTRKKTLTIILLLSLLLFLVAGCTDKKSGDEIVFVPEFIPLPNDIGEIRNLTYANDMLYFTTEIIIDYFTMEASAKIFSINTDGTNLTELANYSHPKSQQDILIKAVLTALSIDNLGNIWIAEGIWSYRFDTPKDFDYEDEEDLYTLYDYFHHISFDIHLRKLDSTGNELLSINMDILPDFDTDNGVYDFEFSNDGKIILLSGESIYILNDDTSFYYLFDALNPDTRYQLVKLSDGNVAVVENKGLGSSLQVINVNDKELGERIELSDNFRNVFPGNDEFLFTYSDSRDFYGYDADTEDFYKILNWSDSGITYSILRSVILLSNGRIVGHGDDGFFSDNRFDLFILTKTDNTNAHEKQVLTLATFSPDSLLTKTVAEFNRSNRTYRIDMTDYSTFNTDYDQTIGITKLSTEIISGNIPDIIDTRYLPFERYAEKGLFVDLYDYLDSDPELNRSDIISNVLSACEWNGGLYRIFPSFSIATIVGNASVVGQDMGWSTDEFIAVINANPQADVPLGNYITKEILMQVLIILGMDEFIDRNTSTASFENNSFISLLEFVNTFPTINDSINYDESEPKMISSGRQIMHIDLSIKDFQRIQVFQTVFGSDVVFKGIPTVRGSGNSFYTEALLSISSSSENKEGAWEFLRSMLTKEWQLSNITDFPTNQGALNENLNKAMAPVYGDRIHIWDDVQIELDALTQEQADQMLAFIYSVDSIISFDDVLMNIILESVFDFFNGLSTAQDAARIIQSRVSIYLAE